MIYGEDELNSSGLETDSPTIEGDPFADEGQRLSVLRRSIVVTVSGYQSLQS